ncbi:MAG: chromosomal replication initiation protein [Parachlamydia sp.]|nr:MAG: chromosomal replication initiation protein [Parachlamydia sp.]
MRAWDEFLILQEAEIGIETVHKWLRSLKVLRYDACNLYLQAKDYFQVMWFEEHMRQKACAKLFNNNNKRIKIHISTNSTDKSKHPKGKGKEKEAQENLSPKFSLTFDQVDPNCTLDQFVISEGNLLAHKLLCKITGFDAVSKTFIPQTSDLAAFNPIYLYGKEGTGKTHLLMATADALRKQGLMAIYSKAETFTEHVVSAIRSGEMSVFRQAYRNIDVLLIDDVHVFSRKGATQEELFHTFNTLHLSGKQILLSSHCLPSDLQLIEPRLVSRFEWGIVLPLEPLNSTEKQEMLSRKAQAFNYPLNPKIAQFLLETFTSSTKALTRALEALILRSHLNQKSGKFAYPTPTLPQVKQYLLDLIAEEERTVLTPQKIVQAVAEFYGIRSEDILGKAQSRECALPRQIAMFLCRNQLKIPYMKIGDLFSRDHSTVMSSVKLIHKGIDEDKTDLSGSVSAILKKLKV